MKYATVCAGLLAILVSAVGCASVQTKEATSIVEDNFFYLHLCQFGVEGEEVKIFCAPSYSQRPEPFYRYQAHLTKTWSKLYSTPLLQEEWDNMVANYKATMEKRGLLRRDKAGLKLPSNEVGRRLFMQFVNETDFEARLRAQVRPPSAEEARVPGWHTPGDKFFRVTYIAAQRNVEAEVLAFAFCSPTNPDGQAMLVLRDPELKVVHRSLMRSDKEYETRFHRISQLAREAIRDPMDPDSIAQGTTLLHTLLSEGKLIPQRLREERNSSAAAKTARRQKKDAEQRRTP